MLIKKILMGSFALLFFSMAMIVFQISCQKDISAQTNGNTYTLPPATTSTLGGIIVGNGLSITSNGTLSVTATTSSGLTQLNKLIFKKVISSGAEIWTANYDGSNATKVNIMLPSGISFSDDMNPIMSPDGTKIFFTAGNGGTSGGDLYCCKADGTNVIKIIDKGGINNNIILGAAY